MGKYLLFFIIVFFGCSYKPDIIICSNCEIVESYGYELKSSVKVTGKTIGSGTIIYYNQDKQQAYVLSSGHLWESNQAKCIIEYLDEEFEGEILLINTEPGYDCSLLRFSCKTEPVFFTIAPKNYEMNRGTQLHSIGCDNNSDPTHYYVQYIGLKKLQNIDHPVIATEHNSPKPGRSGGGLLDSQYLVGVCFATSMKDGTGYGFFTSSDNIHEVLSKEYAWLLSVEPKYQARKIPINKKPPDYIPYPLNL